MKDYFARLVFDRLGGSVQDETPLTTPYEPPAIVAITPIAAPLIGQPVGSQLN